MPALEGTSNTRSIYFYFGALTLLVYIVAPEYLLDIPTSYMLKNRLHAGAPGVSLFRLLTGIPIYVAFLFGLLRDRWNPLGLRDRGYFLIFAPVTAAVFVWMAMSQLSYALLTAGMIMAMALFRFILAAFQGLLALVGQEALMSGRLSTLQSLFYQLALILAAFASGVISEGLTPAQTFYLMAAVTLLIAAFGLFKPSSVFSHRYDRPEACGADFRGDVRRLIHHRAIYPAVLINFLWWFNPGLYTPVQTSWGYSRFRSFPPIYFMAGYARGSPPAGCCGGEPSSPCRRWCRWRLYIPAIWCWFWRSRWG